VTSDEEAEEVGRKTITHYPLHFYFLREMRGGNRFDKFETQKKRK
jgi:hypothetical protein